jgi:light-regulated signal transduction histidine kinase (bacteriophytochrome)
MNHDSTPDRSWRAAAERGQAEAEIRRLNERLAEHAADRQTADHELEALSYSISHDLRAPLRAISGFGRLLDDGYAKALDETGRDYVARIRRSAQHMGELIDDLLNLLRIRGTGLMRAEVDLSAQAIEISDALRAASPERDVEFDIAEGMKARGDPRLLRIALENLLDNAWKFTARRAPARISFRQTEIAGKVAYSVRDNGAGFDMAYAAKLFGAFQRLHDAREYPGNGIGLAIVHRVIVRHGGRIWAEAEPENGAAFYFVLRPEATAPQKSLPLFDGGDADGPFTSHGRRCGPFPDSSRR